MVKILSVSARVTLNSRGEQTVEATVEVEGGRGSFAAPSGASVGKAEAPHLPKGGVLEAVEIIYNEIAPKLVGIDITDQSVVDEKLKEIDGTGNFSRIGGAVAISVSVAAAEACARAKGVPLYEWIGGAPPRVKLPVPLGNVVGGGKHSRWRTTDIQEFLAFPVNARTASEAVFALVAFHRKVGEALLERDDMFLWGRNDEGAWATTLIDEDVLQVLSQVAEDVRSKSGIRFALGVDVAASSLWDPATKLYVYRKSGYTRTTDEQMEYVLGLVKRFKLAYVEDPFHEDDFNSFATLTEQVRDVLVCGDDLYATNEARIHVGGSKRATNAIVIKPNQVGTLTGAIRAAKAAKRYGMMIVASHRSGETTDVHLVHIAIGVSADLIKAGVSGGERIAKLNELVKIEEGLGTRSLLATLPYPK